jgi:hypothetical protein
MTVTTESETLFAIRTHIPTGSKKEQKLKKLQTQKQRGEDIGMLPVTMDGLDLKQKVERLERFRI